MGLVPTTRRAVGALLVGALAVLAACAGPSRTDLARIYAEEAEREKTPLIVIPGVMGSRLMDRRTGEERWPGNVIALVAGMARDFGELALPIVDQEASGPTEHLMPYGLFFEALGEDYYASIVETLEEAGGYRCAPVERATAETDCFLMSWDWRRDLVRGAARLDALIDHVRELREDRTLKVDLVAHSAGALIARYFIRYGDEDVLDQRPATVPYRGAPAVRKAVLLAPPNLGSISGLQDMLAGKRIGWSRVPPEVMATMPSAYQLLPHPERSWMIDVHGDRIERDLYDVETWKRYQWSIFRPEVRERVRDRFEDPEAAERRLAALEVFFARSLARAESFHRALSVPQAEGETEVEYVVFGGDCFMTPALCLIERVEGKPRVRLHPDDVVNRQPGVDYERMMLEPGDGLVTKSSLLARDSLRERALEAFPIDYVVFVCEPHAQLASDVTFRDNLLNILLY